MTTDWDVESDLVSVGSGIGGLAAALTASECGLSAVVLEKAPKVGGVTAYSLGQLWVGANHLAEAAEISDSLADTEAYLAFVAAGYGDPLLVKTFAESAREALRFFADTIGIPFTVIRDLPDYYFPKVAGAASEGRCLEATPVTSEELGPWAPRLTRSPYGYGAVTSADIIAARGDTATLEIAAEGHAIKGERCGGEALSGRFLLACVDRGVSFHSATRVTELVLSGDRVIGVIAQSPAGTLRVKARRAVVLATGGYDWNPEMVRSYEQFTGCLSVAPTTVEGDHLVMACEIGAAVASRPSANLPLNLGASSQLDEDQGHPGPLCVTTGKPHEIIVNRRGQRFGDESFYHDINSALSHFDGARNDHVNWPAWLIFDEQYRLKYSLGGSLAPGELPADVVRSADSLRELAESLGIDAGGLEATVARFNSFCETGNDCDFAKGERPWSRLMFGDPRMPNNPNLGTIEQGPFYAVELDRVTIGIGSVGLKTDAGARVINMRGKPIPGLYAVGNSAAHLDTPGYNSGFGNARGMTKGYFAARAAVAGTTPLAVQ